MTGELNEEGCQRDIGGCRVDMHNWEHYTIFSILKPMLRVNQTRKEINNNIMSL